MSSIPQARRKLLTREVLAQLLQLLRAEGYQLVGPTLRDRALVHAEIEGLEDLPAGWTADQEAGTYQVRRRDDQALFGYAVGPQSWKPWFFVPKQRLFQVRRSADAFEVIAEPSQPRKLALIGARACDLHAIAVQDRVLLEGNSRDPHYGAQRADVFVVAVHCGQAGGTCFCTSMNTGPRASVGFDLALTELVEEPQRFVVDVGSAQGARVLGELGANVSLASERDAQRADEIVSATAQSMKRQLETDGIKELLYRNQEHPRWAQVAERCLACANCTLACPTCFCTTVEDTSGLDGSSAERWRRWDSCFTLDHSSMHGGSVRSSTRARYRQWLTHKLASWIDQFGSSGCVGCGRCVTWCPAGIDITAEVAAIRASDGASSEVP